MGSNGELVWGTSVYVVSPGVSAETKEEIGGSGGAFTVTGGSRGTSSGVAWDVKTAGSKEKETNLGVAEMANLSRVILFSRVRN